MSVKGLKEMSATQRDCTIQSSRDCPPRSRSGGWCTTEEVSAEDKEVQEVLEIPS
jgi:hypothetical protein